MDCFAKIAYENNSFWIKNFVKDFAKTFNNKFKDLKYADIDFTQPYKLVDKEKELKKEETDLIKQKNVISNEEFEKKLSLLRNKASDYQKQRKKFNDSINKKRLDATSELVSLIQPILAEYANNNSISIIFQKKNIIIGKTELDITEDILKILNANHKKIAIN